jgi:hypothetical protein
MDRHGEALGALTSLTQPASPSFELAAVRQHVYIES